MKTLLYGLIILITFSMNLFSKELTDKNISMKPLDVLDKSDEKLSTKSPSFKEKKVDLGKSEFDMNQRLTPTKPTDKKYLKAYLNRPKPLKSMSLSLVKGEILFVPGEMVSLTHRLEKNQTVVQGDSLYTRGYISRVNINDDLTIELGYLSQISIKEINDKNAVIQLDRGIMKIMSRSDKPKLNYIVQSSNLKVMSDDALFVLANNQQTSRRKKTEEKIVWLGVHQGTTEVRLVEYSLDNARVFKPAITKMGESKKFKPADQGAYVQTTGWLDQINWDINKKTTKNELLLIEELEQIIDPEKEKESMMKEETNLDDPLPFDLIN